MRSLLVFSILLALSACSRREPAPPAVHGDAVVGARLVDQFQCGACHTIPAIPAAQGRTGPTLAAFGRRSYIAGSIPNVPDKLARWLVNPAALKPDTAMPAMGVSDVEAHHMAAYLATLR
ncbi:c-type cytochrome [Massilia sp. S19_KUP03_FR1]|uniref:c-type cytochrome n=1 Tax=Massilia sp. S19_KUP03_FR1 TaxID=3025503 RepID=UPI002FCD4B73